MKSGRNRRTLAATAKEEWYECVAQKWYFLYAIDVLHVYLRIHDRRRHDAVDANARIIVYYLVIRGSTQDLSFVFGLFYRIHV